MDQQRDFNRFTNLLRRLCRSLQEFDGDDAFNPLLETWWKALRHVDYQVVSDRVDDFLAKADKDTKFPRPAQMRPVDMPPPAAGELAGNPARDYWRSTIVNEVARLLGHTHLTLEPHICGLKEFARALLDLLNDETDQELRFGRSHGMHVGCHRRCEEIARAYIHLAKPDAPVLFKPIGQAAA
jgi:hypothetical protein